MVNVSWTEATAYVQWLGERTHRQCRLPTEAEWEYAARAGTRSAYPWGDEVRRDSQGKEQVMANCKGCGSAWDGEQSAPVGSFPPNAFCLYYMSGNVYERTCSLWREQFDGSEERCADEQDPDLPLLRGGSWGNGQGVRALGLPRPGSTRATVATDSGFGCCVRPPSSGTEH